MLGVNVGQGTNIKDDIFKTLTERMAFWNKFHYNEVDRIEILNAFIVPSVTHIFRHTPFDYATNNSLDKLATDFVWSNKRRYISKNILYQKLKNGGLGAVPIGKIWIKDVRSWFNRAVITNSQAPILKVTEARYEKTCGHKLSHLFRRGIVAGKKIKKPKSVLQSSFELSRKAWSDSLDLKSLEDQPILENVRILKDGATTQISNDNLPKLEDETIPSTLWLQQEIEKINNKQRKSLSDVLTTHLKSRLNHHLKAVLMTPPTRTPESRTATLRSFINSTTSSTLNILKINTDAAEERILTTAKKALEESNP